ncbi:hypothetical protein ACJRO7_009257 [Eucalyptus globulus]|uniref:HVA22-like protein n=2 Tax=Eucalyptus globulus TaxID=34317 RepID=A0ABD3LD94_EUCGL
MGHLWTLLTHARSLAGPMLMLFYPVYASVMAIESPSKIDDEQWLAYWILYSFLTHVEMLLQPLFEWIPIWYDVKLILAAWLVLPQSQGAAFLYKRFVREHILKWQPKSKSSPTTYPRGILKKSKSKSFPTSSPNGKPKSKKKVVRFSIPTNNSHE